tara:strand:+ start:2292 stop:2708 length:417 start_codon:yes stop_codon:yes gene_type:complete
MSASTKDLLALTEGILSETPSVEKVIVPNHEGKPVEDDGLRDVVVPNAFVNQIVGFNEALNESSDPDKKQEMMPDFEPITESAILKERLETLVESLKQLLKEARNVMEEMTTTGMIGVNLAPVKKNGSRKRNKRNKSN